MAVESVFDMDLQSFWKSTIGISPSFRVRPMSDSRRIRRRTRFTPNGESPSFSSPGMNGLNTTHVRR